MWRLSYAKAEEASGLKFSEEEKNEALLFDILAFHTLLFKVFKILDLKEAQSCSTEEYLKEYQPYFQQSFLNEKKKLEQFKKGIEQSMVDVVFVQEPDELLIKDLEKFREKYFVEISPDQDTLILAKRSRFDKQFKSSEMLQRLEKGERDLLDWNKHTCVMYLDNYMLISGHLNSKPEKNQENVKDLHKILPIILEKYH